MVEESIAPPGTVLEAARDFSERRADLWPDVHVEHLEVHDRGETWADVTEGNPWPIGFVWDACATTGRDPDQSKQPSSTRTSSSLEARGNFARRLQAAAAGAESR